MARTFDYESLTDEQKAKFNESLATNESFLSSISKDGKFQPEFANAVFNKIYAGELNWDQVNRNDLTQEQRATYDSGSRAFSGYDAILNGTGRLTDDDIGEFVRGMYNLETRSPEQFNALLAANPEMGLRYLASMGTGRYMVGQDLDYKDYRNRADQVGYQMGVDAGYGEDGKQDGKTFVSGYDKRWSDVSNEGGRGDFLKLGKPGSMSGGLGDFVEDNPLQTAGMVVAAVAAPYASAALVNMGYTAAQAAMITAAGTSAVNTALQGGDVSDILKNSTVAAGTAGAMEYVPGFGDVYSAQNVGGAFVRGTANDALSQLAFEGNIDVGDAVKTGVINVGVEGLFDLLGDAKQTNDGNLIEGVDTLNGAPISQEDIERLTNTSDLYGILGDDGLLAQLGINPGELSIGDIQILQENGYLNTSFIGDSYDAIDSVLGLDFGGRPVVDPGGKIAEQARSDIEALGTEQVIDPLTGQPRIRTTAERSEALDNIMNQYYADTARYDERFFDLTTPRGNVNMPGIHEQNPTGKGNTSTVGQSALPKSGSGSVRSDSQTPRADSVNYGEAVYADVGESTLPESTITDSTIERTPAYDDNRELVLGGELPDDWLPPGDTQLPPEIGRTPEYEFTYQDYIPDTDNEDIPSGGGETYIPGTADPLGGGGDFEPDWTELFPYTKLTPLQKKALRPYVGLIAAMRQGGVA